MKIQPIYSFIFSVFQPSKIQLNKILPWLPPSHSSIELSSRVKVLFCLTLSTVAIYKIKGIAAHLWSQPAPHSPPPPPPPPPPDEPNAVIPLEPTPKEPLLLTPSGEKGMNGEESAKNLKYLHEIFAQKKIPEKHQTMIDAFLTKIVREERDVSILDFNLCVILISTFDLICKNPSLKTDNPQLLEILKNVILSEFQIAIRKNFFLSTNIQILTNNARLFMIQGEKAQPSNYTEDEQVQIAQYYYGLAHTLSPPILISLCLHFIRTASFEKAAQLYVLATTRIEQDWAIYSKYPKVFKEDFLTRFKNDVSNLTVNLKPHNRKTWVKALKAAKKNALPIPCHYDFRWPIFSMLIDQAMKTVGDDQPFAMEGEPLFKMCDRGMIYQSICIQEFAADPRFQTLE